MKRSATTKTVVLSVLALFLAGMAWAQQGDAPSDNMQILREKIQADKKLLVATNMQLTESEAKAFWPVYDSYQKELEALNGRTLKNVADYAANADVMTDDLAEKIVTEQMAVDSERQKIRQSFLPRFARVIPYRKVMRYYQLENKILAVITYEAAARIPLVQ
jgi:hypothetical protein